MLKNFFLFAAAVLLFVCAAGCDGKKTAAEANAEQLKAERAKRKIQAAKYYNELVEKYPDSPYASQARERLQAIGPVATPPGAHPAVKLPVVVAPPAGTARK
jgi:outer membrane protein assembly factor BamD (BamD/ComL family)